MWSLSLIMVILATTFIQMKHPLSMSLILLIQTVLISIQTGMLSLNTWFSYIMFLIMVGGMLVLFIYMTSVASNEKFSYKVNDLILPLSSLTLLGITYKVSEQTSNFHNMWTLNMNPQLIKYLNFPSNSIILMMMVYLLIALIAVVNISNISYGPLRQKL
uniref:NADH-ubiquinone oxidoreductase chain 6 n=1 Tax=Histeridae sp. BMNH 1274741 TaxID=1796509 RepID=A0A126TGH1_9COLE|nr:NADH dehydrogenase subunit 6 [Histeridae sp. BMNH 1274741]